jgi:addiction module RelE/StbE family toxin
VFFELPFNLKGIQIELFKKDPYNPQLDNHELQREYVGYRSIDITNDYRALYEEAQSDNETIAYFSLLGTHKELFKT